MYEGIFVLNPVPTWQNAKVVTLKTIQGQFAIVIYNFLLYPSYRIMQIRLVHLTQIHL